MEKLVLLRFTLLLSEALGPGQSTFELPSKDDLWSALTTGLCLEAAWKSLIWPGPKP